MFYIIDHVVGTPVVIGGGVVTYGLLYMLYAFAVLIPGLAVLVRRLHDTNRTGWWVLISLIPCLGTIVIIVFLVLPSDPAENKYGPCPLDT